jgi:hypothetical protein
MIIKLYIRIHLKNAEKGRLETIAFSFNQAVRPAALQHWKNKIG